MFLFSLSLFIGTLFVMTKAQKIISTAIPRDFPVLVDFFHCESLDFSEYYMVSDYFIMSGIFLLFTTFNSFWSSFLYDLSLIYMLRTLSFSLTILPKCGKMKDKDNNRTCAQILWDYASFKDRHTGHNNDLLFSGHTAFMTLYCLHVSYFYPEYVYFNFICAILTGGLSVWNVFSRCHYSIDILYALITTTLIFQNNHYNMVPNGMM